MRDESRPALSVVGSNGATPAIGARKLPQNIAVKCPNCRELLVSKDVEKNLKVCQKCGHHFRLGARERIDLLLDADSFRELDADLQSADPLSFTSSSGSYRDKLAREMDATGLTEGVVAGTGTLEEQPLVIVVMDFAFIGGSMGSVVGEKITRGLEYGAEHGLPVVVFSASGGARMQENLLSLFQMAKTSAAIARLNEAGQPFISVLTDPTTGGVAASFAMLGDVILAEPGALVGFAGPRVIEQAMHQRLPKDTNTAEFVLAHGMVDGIVHRRSLRPTLARVLRLHRRGDR